MKKELLIKFLDNRCSQQELEEIIQWFDRDALSDKSKDIAFNDWESFREGAYSSGQNARFNLLLDRIHHQININKFTKPDIKRTQITSSITKWLSTAAAILFIPVLSILIYILSDNTFESAKYADMVIDSLEIISPIGSRTIVQLSDGTEVHLNSGSRMKYPRNFHGDTRELALSGEGFFNVAHDPKHPFVVKTKKIRVKALGTKFNVLTYPDDDLVETTLIEGKVVLEQYSGNGNTNIIGSLVPGQHVNYNVTTGAILSTKGNIEKFIAWKDGILVFDNSAINEIAEKLGHLFNVETEVADEIRDYTYTVKFVDESLSQILDLLTKAAPVNYIILPREKLPDGTFSKQKILFKKR